MLTKILILVFRNRIVIFLLGAILAAGVFWSLLQLPFDPFGVQAAMAKPAPVVTPRFTAAALQRVVTVNKASEANGVEFRINSVEVYNDGFSFTYEISSFNNPNGPMFLQPETIQVTDSAGTTYVESLDASSAAVGFGLSRGYVTFMPGAGAKVQNIKISVPHMLVVGGNSDTQTKVVDGPWSVEASLQ